MHISIRVIMLAKAAMLLITISFSQLSMAQQEFSCVGMPYMDAHERRLRALDQAVNRRLESPRYMLSPYPPEDDPDAILPDPDPVGALRELNDMRTDRLQSHERAEVFNYIAYAHYLNDNIPQSLNFYKQSIAEEGANGSLIERNLKTMASLYSFEDDFQEALKYYLNWACLRLQKPETFLSSRDYYDLGSLYYRLNDLDQALFYTEKAIGMEETAGNIGRENWYYMQRTIYYLKGNVPAAITVLKKMIVYYPNVKYWRELGSMFSELEDARSQLAAYQLAYMQNGLETENQMKGFSLLMLAAGAPYEAANLMIEGIDSGLIEADEDVMRTVGSAFYQAREMDKALPWMERAADEGGEGEAYGALTAIYASLLRYEDAVRVGNEALRLGDLNRPDQIKLQIGGAHAALREYDEAIESFRSITDSRSTGAANNWIGYATSEKNREAQIRASGINLDEILGDF